ncbi:hypothetical protein D3C73_1440520 [compost metagenome]
MLCSEEDCVINTTLICSLANKVKSRPLNPDLPIIPDPLRLITEMSEIEEIPLIGNAVFPLSNWITVPEKSGSKVFRITIGIFFKNAGIIVGG